MMNVVNGGVHAKNSIDFQEFMVMPIGAAIVLRGVAMGRRDLSRAEGSARQARSRDARWATKEASRPDLPHNETAVKVLVEAIEATGRTPGSRHRDRARPRGERVLP